MAYLPYLHRCAACGKDLGPDNGDGVCAGCDGQPVRCRACGRFVGDGPCVNDECPVGRANLGPADTVKEQ